KPPAARACLGGAARPMRRPTERAPSPNRCGPGTPGHRGVEFPRRFETAERAHRGPGSEGEIRTVCRTGDDHQRLPNIREESMVTHVDVDIQQVWREYRADPHNVELRNQLVEHYLPLVKYNAERIWSRLPEGVDLDDLISAGVFGLMDAIDAFDLDRGVKFETYCVTRISGALLDA